MLTMNARGRFDPKGRPLTDEDMARLRRFLAEVWRDAGPANGCAHVGDLLWGRFMYEDTVVNPAGRFRFWEGMDGRVLGFACFYPPATIDFSVHPRLRAEADLYAAMLAWGDERRRAFAGNDVPKPLSVTVMSDDAATGSLLSAVGFSPTADDPLLYFTRNLSDAIPAPAVPEGFVVRSLRGEAEYDERVAIHREVWHPSRVTIGAYRRLRTVDGYDPELDLVAVAPDGTFAAYAILWYDPATRTAEFEPVGARPAFRGRGLTKAVLLEGLRRVRERGAELAIVYTGEDRLPARRLYESVGFRVVNQWVNWQRTDQL
jgi:ribosomal protein S18 acetylase RimI-like enzyme